MEDVVIDMKNDIDLRNSFIIIGFPTVGLTGSIAANYMIETLKLDLVGYIYSKYFRPAVIIRDLKPVPTIRIYYTDTHKCENNGICDRLIVIVSDLPIPSPMVYPFTFKLLSWIDERGISMFLAFEGIKTKEYNLEQVDVYGIGSNKKMVDFLKKYKIKPANTGIITGFSGALLNAVTREEKNMITLMTEANKDYPDSMAAVRLLETVKDFLPGIDLNLNSLYKEAEKLEKEIKHIMDRSKSSAERDNIHPNTYL